MKKLWEVNKRTNDNFCTKEKPSKRISAKANIVPYLEALFEIHTHTHKDLLISILFVQYVNIRFYDDRTVKLKLFPPQNCNQICQFYSYRNTNLWLIPGNRWQHTTDKFPNNLLRICWGFCVCNILYVRGGDTNRFHCSCYCCCC